MGAYLDKPNTEKQSVCKEFCKNYVYGASSMQGWRISQEDAHTCLPQFDGSDRHFFAVYDGHGGSEVATYLAENFPAYLKTVTSYESDNFDQALKDAFLGFDAKLIEESVVAELKVLAGLEGDDSNVAEEAEALSEEASMPILQVLERHGGLDALPAALKNRLKERMVQDFKSPLLKAKLNQPDVSDEGAGGSSAPDEPSTPKVNGISKVQNPVSGNSSASATMEGVADNQNNSNLEKAKLNGSAEEDDSDSDEEFNPEADDDAEDDDDEVAEDSDSEEEEEEEDSSDEEDGPEMLTAGEEPGVDSGSTAVVALMVGSKLYVANTGDSRCVVSDNGTAIDLSIDHKPEDDLEKNRIEAAGGHVTKEGRVNGGLNLSRALGDHAYKKNPDLGAAEQVISAMPDIQVLDLKPSHNFMLLACDGIWNCMTSQEAVDFCEKRFSAGMRPDQVCEALFDHCLAPNTDGDGTGCDNMTAVLVQLQGSRKRHISGTNGHQVVSEEKRLRTSGEGDSD